MPTVLHIFTVPISLRFVRGLPAFLAKRGYEMSVVTSPGTVLDAFVSSEGCTGFSVNMRRKVAPFEDIVALCQLIRVIRRVKPDIVHGHTPKGGLLGMMAASAAGVPKRIYHMRGLPLLTATGPTRIVFHVTERVSCHLASRVLCVSDSLRTSAIELGLVPSSRIQVLLGGSGQGVDAGREFVPGAMPDCQIAQLRRNVSLHEGEPVVLFVGRLVRDKGVVDLADAWEIVSKKMPEARLLLVGAYEPRDPVPERIVERLRDDKSVIQTGWTDTPAQYYPLANVVVLPSHREGFPNVPLEAAAMELPVVATRIPGCVDAVEDGTTGTLVPTASPEALAEAILGYLRNSGRAAAHGRAGRARVLAKFQREKLWAAMADVYDELLEGSSLLRQSSMQNGELESPS